ncbi:MAG: hypothetical protein LBB74_05795 [Chitinispirillales bacterium]|nr:hypothetical protein [Chitinispirillales bacterium]
MAAFAGASHILVTMAKSYFDSTVKNFIHPHKSLPSPSFGGFGSSRM